MNKNRPNAGGDRGCPSHARSMRVIVFSAIGVASLLSACAKRPGVAASQLPATVTRPMAQERTVPGGSEPGLSPPMAANSGIEAGSGPSSSLPPGSEVVARPPVPAPEQPAPRALQATSKESPLKDIFFDFDASALRPDAKAALAEDVAWLHTHPHAAITIGGYCDERGTTEYNLGLGERRAQASKGYLAAAGIDATRLRTISYGKEHPFVLGHDESAWKWNRRDHVVVAKQ